MRRLVPQSLASSSSAISCRWNTATWADRRLTLPLGVLSRSSQGLSLCATLFGSLSFPFSLSSFRDPLSFSVGWSIAVSWKSFFSGRFCSFLLTEENSVVTTWRIKLMSIHFGKLQPGPKVFNWKLQSVYILIRLLKDLTLSFPVLLLVSGMLSLLFGSMVMLLYGECSVRTW